MWKIICLTHFVCNFAEFGDPSRRFCHCVAPNHVFYKGFGIAWHQTVLFTMVLAFHWTHFWCSWTKYRRLVETICAFIFVFSPLSSLFRFFLSFYDPSRLFFVFLFFVLLQKCSPLGLAEKSNFYIFKRILFTIVFFGRSGARFYVIFQGLSNSQNGW